MLINQDWRYYRGPVEGAEDPAFDDSRWELLCLPHCVSELFEERPYQGDCWYRKVIQPAPDAAPDALHMLVFEASMHTTDIWVNGEHLLRHAGGYLPFHVDFTEQRALGEDVVVAVRVNNEDHPDLPPGRPMRMLDRVYYGGLYQNVHQRSVNRLHFTRPESCHLPGAGVFVGTRNCDAGSASLHVRFGIMNAFEIPHECRLLLELCDEAGVTKAAHDIQPVSIEPGELLVFDEELEVADPELWSLATPYLYNLTLSLLDQEGERDRVDVPVGIRHIEVDSQKGFSLNGEPLTLHGVNRHADSPGMGSALSNAAHYRDAVRIKESGFNLVRCGDLPQASSFLEACDQIGLLVIDSLTGWEYGQQTAAHEQHLFDNCRALVQRDRNHPSVIAWDVSIYESGMFEEMMTTMHSIAHDEFPGDQMITLGRAAASSHDVFGMDCSRGLSIASASLPTLLLNVGGELDEPGGALGFLARASRDMQVPHIGTIVESMFSHLRGDRGGINTGVLDDYRRPLGLVHTMRTLHAMPDHTPPWVFIMDEWVPGAEQNILVFSNCPVVSLFLNGEMVETGKASSSQDYQGLSYPPFIFSLPNFEPGTLRAAAYRGDVEVATHQLRTPEEAVILSLSADLRGRDLQADGADAVFVHTETLDQNGTRVTDSLVEVRFQVDGAGIALTPLTVSSVDGIASVVVQSRVQGGEIRITAFSPGLTEGICRFSSS